MPGKRYIDYKIRQIICQGYERMGNKGGMFCRIRRASEFKEKECKESRFLLRNTKEIRRNDDKKYETVSKKQAVINVTDNKSFTWRWILWQLNH